MLFKESGDTYTSLPSWARFMLDFGCYWQTKRELDLRRIALISMPCDSAAAGLVVLGAMTRDLCDPYANDIDGHYDRLLRYARQYLHVCRPCELKCNPQLARCGYSKEATGLLRSPLLPRKTVEISDKTNFEERQIAWIQRDGRRNQCLVNPLPQHTVNYHIDNEPPPQWNNVEGKLLMHRYNFIDAAQFHPDNFRKSYSGLCLAGRMGGGNASREICASVRFCDESGEQGLEDLITVHGWSDCNISRVSFFNTRTGEFDRYVEAPRLVVADGDASFLRIAGQTEFHQSDIIGVIHRTVERDRLDALGNKMSALRQWYVQDEDMLLGLPGVPRGMSISILKRRHN
ncbi:MAG: hypothetical protein RL693_781 [Verrucomicrobiota bacterium]|jgi:hypothetical protein